jgi:tetratricopeptide (TPR) repeat protein/CHAT domain-containing protein
MNKILNIILFGLLAQMASAQPVRKKASSLHDSLRQSLTYFVKVVPDTRVKLLLSETRKIYKKDTLNNAIADKLVAAEKLLLNYENLNHQKILQCGELLVRVLKQSFPLCENNACLKGTKNLAFIYEQLGEYEKALPLYDYVATTKKKLLGEEHAGYAEGLNSLAVLYERMGEYNKALLIAEQALVIRQKTIGEETLEYAESLTTLGLLLYMDLGENEKALPLIRQALAIRKKLSGELDPYYAENLNNLAGIYESMGAYDKALPVYQQEAAILRKTIGVNHPDYAYNLNDMAYLYEDLGQYEKALILYKQALAIRRKSLGQQHPYYATGLNNLAGLYSKLDDLEKAILCAKQALEIQRKALGEENSDYAISLNNLARLLLRAGRNEQVLPLLKKALSIREKFGGEDPYYLAAINNLGDFFLKTGDYQKALELYNQAEVTGKKTLGKEHPNYAQSLYNLGLVYWYMNNPTRAVSFFNQAINITTSHLHRTYSSLSEQEKISFFNQQQQQFDYLPSILYSAHFSDSVSTARLYNNELTMKGMVLEDQRQVLNSIRKSNDSITVKVYTAWRSNRTLIGKQLLLPLKERGSYLDSIEKVTLEMEQQLSRSSAEFEERKLVTNTTVAEILNKLQTDEATIEFMRFRFYNKNWTDSIMYAALVLLPGVRGSHFIPLFEERQLTNLLELSNSNAENLYGDERGASTVCRSLYRLIWQPLEQYLNEIHIVHYAPAGLLHRIAFDALSSGTSRSLIDVYDLHQVLSTRSVLSAESTEANHLTASVWGNIKYDLTAGVAKRKLTRGQPAISQAPSHATLSTFNFYNSNKRNIRTNGWGPLPGTVTELDSLQTLFRQAGISVTTLSGSNASEENFKQLDGKSPALVHLATHGFFLPASNITRKIDVNAGGAFKTQVNPLFRSGLVLAGGNICWRGLRVVAGKEDGILTAYEIAQMDLSETNLVVLSACETGLGDIHGSEGVVGLQRAFKMAGAKQMILSLWSVYDEPTREFMTVFYKQLVNGTSSHNAFRSAKMWLKQKYPSPYIWASFILVE